MGEIVQAAALLLTGLIFIGSAYLLLRLVTGDSMSYERNRARTGGFIKNLRGEVPQVSDGTRDSRVAAGIAIDVKKNEWREQGKLSDEAVAAVLRRS